MRTLVINNFDSVSGIRGEVFDGMGNKVGWLNQVSIETSMPEMRYTLDGQQVNINSNRTSKVSIVLELYHSPAENISEDIISQKDNFRKIKV